MVGREGKGEAPRQREKEIERDKDEARDTNRQEIQTKGEKWRKRREDKENLEVEMRSVVERLIQ